MKAVMYEGPRSLMMREVARPVPAEGEALVEIAAVGICGSDMHGYHGRDPRRVAPLILGHEATGICRGGPHEGNLVALNPLISCGRCDDCGSGRTNLCPERELIGMNRPGAFAEFIAMPEVNLLALPSGLGPAEGALMEPVATGLHAIGIAARVGSKPLAEAKVGVCGAGAVGFLTALSLRALGVGELVVSELNPGRREMAARYLDARIIDPRAASVAPGSLDVVIDGVGARASRAQAVEWVRPGGVVVHVGLHETGGELDIRRLTLSEITFVGSYTYTRADLELALTLLGRGNLGHLGWLEERSLDEAARAFSDLDHGQVAGAKVVLRP